MASQIPASGNVELPLSKMVDLMAASSTFRTAVGAVDAAKAKEFIYVHEAPPSDCSRVELHWQERSWQIQNRTQFFLTGVITVGFEHKIIRSDYVDDKQDAVRTFGNLVGGIESDWFASLKTNYENGTDLYPGIVTVDGPEIECPDPPEHLGNYVFTAQWDLMVKLAM